MGRHRAGGGGTGAGQVGGVYGHPAAGFCQEALAMPSHADILDRTDPLAKSFWTSLTLHVAVLGLFSAGAVLDAHRINMGSPTGGGLGGVLVNPVASIPIPNRGGPENPVANDTKSELRSEERRGGKESRPTCSPE